VKSRIYPLNRNTSTQKHTFRSLHGSLYLLLFSLIIAIFCSGCTGAADAQQEPTGHIMIDGSTALQPLVATAAKLFHRQHPQTTITVNGGGSVSGLKDVTSGKSNIGNSDIYADPALYPDPNLTDHIVCVVPFTMIVNPQVTVTSLTQQQIIDIFSTGKIRNWDEVGGPDLPIVPIVRPQTSGTRATFRKYVLGGGDEKGTLLQTDSSTTVRATVAHTPGAIGYLALSVFNNSVHQVAIDGLNATASNIESGNYTFWGYEHMYTLGDNNKLIATFLDYMLTTTVQQEATKQSYIPIAGMKLPSLGTGGGSVSFSTYPSESEATLREHI
jgi:phosphate transport system substrate-binding protein